MGLAQSVVFVLWNDVGLRVVSVGPMALVSHRLLRVTVKGSHVGGLALDTALGGRLAHLVRVLLLDGGLDWEHGGAVWLSVVEVVNHLGRDGGVLLALSEWDLWLALSLWFKVVGTFAKSHPVCVSVLNYSFGLVLLARCLLLVRNTVFIIEEICLVIKDKSLVGSTHVHITKVLHHTHVLILCLSWCFHLVVSF